MCRVMDIKYNQGYESGHARGLEQGLEQALVDVLRKMISKGYTLDSAMDFLDIEDAKRNILKKDVAEANA